MKTGLISFALLFREQGEAETRTITTQGHAMLPDDEYALVEFYCPDPACDCRRVMLNVLPRRQAQRGYLAYISFGFDPDNEMAELLGLDNPCLDPMNPQSAYSPFFLNLVTQMLEDDPAYVARLESHYHQVKQAMADPTHPVHRVLARLERGSKWMIARQKTKGSRGRPKKRRRR